MALHILAYPIAIGFLWFLCCYQAVPETETNANRALMRLSPGSGHVEEVLLLGFL